MDRLAELGGNVRGNIEAGLKVTTQQVAWAHAVRGRMWAFFERFFERHDFLLTPSMAVSPFPVEQNYPETVGDRAMKTYVDWIAPTFTLSLTGLPVASVPCGLDAPRTARWTPSGGSTARRGARPGAVSAHPGGVPHRGTLSGGSGDQLSDLRTDRCREPPRREQGVDLVVRSASAKTANEAYPRVPESPRSPRHPP